MPLDTKFTLFPEVFLDFSSVLSKLSDAVKSQENLRDRGRLNLYHFCYRLTKPNVTEFSQRGIKLSARTNLAPSSLQTTIITCFSCDSVVNQSCERDTFIRSQISST